MKKTDATEFSEKSIVHSSPPIVYFLWIMVSVLIIFWSIITRIQLLYILILSSIIILVLYYVLAQYACRFSLSETNLEINYLFPFKNSIILDLSKIKKVQLRLSYFYFLDDDFRMGVLLWSHPFDSLTIFLEGEEDPLYININSSYLASRRLYRCLKNKFSE